MHGHRVNRGENRSEKSEDEQGYTDTEDEQGYKVTGRTEVENQKMNRGTQSPGEPW